MASGSYATKKLTLPESDEILTQTRIPARATRQLPEVAQEEEEGIDLEANIERSTKSRALQQTQLKRTTISRQLIVEDHVPPPLERHHLWLNPLLISMVCVIIGAGVLVSAAVMQRPTETAVVNFFGGKVYSVQVGGYLANSWQSNKPLPPKVTIPPHTGPYSVLGKPTITVAFINEVLASYGSPAAGQGQALYDLGVQYGIDPAFALAFFMHESSFGTVGEAHSSLSLGNLRCIPNFECRDGYAWFPSWQAGFKAWYALIRNLYVAVWGLTTVPQIIPRYAPPSDNNNDDAYISSVEHAIDTWHAGILRP